jgi:hypothetical protein
MKTQANPGRKIERRRKFKEHKRMQLRKFSVHRNFIVRKNGGFCKSVCHLFREASPSRFFIPRRLLAFEDL